jgi:hypothetical protein
MMLRAVIDRVLYWADAFVTQNVIQLLTSDEVDLLIYQPRVYFSSTPDLSILFTSEVLFLKYFEFYQHSTAVVSSNQFLGILEVFNKCIS